MLLGDLGRAALLDSDGVAGREGTWCTTAPETAPDNGVCSKASDIYSLAATVFYLLSGGYPVDNSLSDLERQALITVGRRRCLRDLAPHVSRGLAMVIEKSLSTDPAHRHQSALDFGNSLVGAGAHSRAWRRISHPGHQHCLRGGAAGAVKPVTVCAVANGTRVAVLARLESGRRPPGWTDREGRLPKLAQLLRAVTESL